MFYYFGGKMSLAKMYPPPHKDIIIEPFAGSAQYSLYGDNWKKQVILYDKYDLIVNLWKWLIEKATKEDILNTPDMEYMESVTDLKLCQPLKDLIGFCVRRGNAKPAVRAAKPQRGEPGYNSWFYHKHTIAENLYKIKHWKIYQDSYENIDNIDATWFIDPPYMNGGQSYVESNKNIDYSHLAEWCKSRKGQIIVCENTDGTWLDFKPIKSQHTTRDKFTTECLWYNESGSGINEFNGSNLEELKSEKKFSFGGF